MTVIGETTRISPIRMQELEDRATKGALDTQKNMPHKRTCRPGVPAAVLERSCSARICWMYSCR